MTNKNILILYGSTTGNSENLAKFCSDHLKKNKQTTKIINVADISNKYIIDSKYNFILICTSTWGIEPAVLQDDFDDFINNKLDKKSIKNHQFIIFSLGDSYYPNFAYAANILEEYIKKQEGIIIIPSLKIQDPWENLTSQITENLNHLLTL